MTEISAQLREIASWRVAAELIRRYPNDLSLAETHPGGGQYDCLTLSRRGSRDPLDVVFDLNRNGSAHVRPHQPEGPALRWSGFWEDYAHAADPKEVLDRLAEAAGLPIGHKPPVSSAVVLTYRVIASLLTLATFGRSRWECRQGRDDGNRQDWPLEFPDAPGVQPDDCWYLLRDDEPKLQLTTQGNTTDRQGRQHCLRDLYAAHGRIIATAFVVGGQLFR